MAMVFCLYGVFKNNLCLSWCFFIASIYYGFPLLLSKLSDIVMSSLEVISTLQNHCLPQTTIIELNSIQGIFLTLSNLKVSSSFHQASILSLEESVTDILAH